MHSKFHVSRGITSSYPFEMCQTHGKFCVSIEVITNRYDILHTRLKRASHRLWGVILVCSFDLKLLGTCFENYCEGSRHRHTPVEGCDNNIKRSRTTSSCLSRDMPHFITLCLNTDIKGWRYTSCVRCLNVCFVIHCALLFHRTTGACLLRLVCEIYVSQLVAFKSTCFFLV